MKTASSVKLKNKQVEEMQEKKAMSNALKHIHNIQAEINEDYDVWYCDVLGDMYNDLNNEQGYYMKGEDQIELHTDYPKLKVILRKVKDIHTDKACSVELRKALEKQYTEWLTEEYFKKKSEAIIEQNIIPILKSMKTIGTITGGEFPLQSIIARVFNADDKDL